MSKFFLRFFIIVIISVVPVIIFLSYFGVETDRFDGLIKNRANEVNRYIKLEFKKTKIHLNLNELNLAIKLQNPKILIKNHEIDLSKLNLFLSLKSYFSSDFLLKRAEVSFAENDIKDLRNNLENTDPDSVLDGDIDEFLEAALYQTKENK